MESEGCVSLKPGLDAHLSKCNMTINHSDFDKTIATSVSSVSSHEDDEDVFVRSPKVKFVKLESIASSSVSYTPIQDIMNTPKIQLAKLRRQLVDEKNSRDGLEKELSQTINVLSERESQINRMQYSLDKLKKEQDVREQRTMEQIEELKNKNDLIQSRYNEVLKQNKELKGDAVVMARQVDKLTKEHGECSIQISSMSTKLANSQAEAGQLKATQSTNEAEWRSTTRNLQMELNVAQDKERDLLEQIEILQGKNLCLEDQNSRSTQQEGDNMWISVEKAELENKICVLRDELDNKTNCLWKIEADVSTQTEQLLEMAEKTPGCKEADALDSLTLARSHPNLSSAHESWGLSTELFATPVKVTGSDTDELIGLPEYRRSTIHTCAENGPENWRTAELQAQNEACLPHLKSSYPLEFDEVHHSALAFTDDELRTGDPIETIQRESVMSGQLQDSLASHRLSYMVGQGGAAATARSRLSLI